MMKNEDIIKEIKTDATNIMSVIDQSSTHTKLLYLDIMNLKTYASTNISANDIMSKYNIFMESILKDTRKSRTFEERFISIKGTM
jgi:hypothetical protein